MSNPLAVGTTNFGLAATYLLIGSLIMIAVLIATVTAMSWFRGTRAVRENTRESEDSLAQQLAASNAELKQMSDRLRVALWAGRVGLWQLDTRTGAQWLSPELLELVGLEPGDVESFGSFGRRIHVADREEALARSGFDPGVVVERRFRMLHEDGTYRWMLARSMLDANHRTPHVVHGAIVDITTDHEHELLLEDLNRELIDSNQSLDGFTRVASHDLRSPLRAIRSLVGFLREDAPEPLDPGTEKYLERIENRVSRAELLIDDLLDYARAGDSRHDLSFTDPELLIQEVLETVSRPDGIEAVVQVDSTAINVEVVPLVTCVRNLVDNAFKHHEGSTGLVSIVARQGHDFVEFQVADDGPGLDETQCEAVFEPFRKMHSRPDVAGSGIGLSVLKRTVEAHGGTIHVDSELGVGSTFTLRWPLAPLNLVEDPAHHVDIRDYTRHDRIDDYRNSIG